MRFSSYLILVTLSFGCAQQVPHGEVDTDPKAQRLLLRLADADTDVRFHARLELIELKGAAVPLLAQALDSKDRNTRFEAAAALCQMRSVLRTKAVPGLIRAVQERDTGLQEVSLQALGSMGPGAQDAAPAIRRILRGKYSPASKFAPYALARILGGEAVPDLVLLAKGGPKKLRFHALYALEELGPAARPAIPGLRRLREDNNPAVREAVDEALKKIEKDV